LLLSVEKGCKEMGWDVKLVEKPLYGLQDEPITAVEEARSMLHAVKKSVQGFDDDDVSIEPSYEESSLESGACS